MSEAPTAGPVTVGRMIVDLIDNGSSRPQPRVTFAPVGRFTPGLLQHYEMFFWHEIDKAQAAVRHAARASPSQLPTLTIDYPQTDVEELVNDLEATPARRRAR